MTDFPDLRPHVTHIAHHTTYKYITCVTLCYLPQYHHNTHTHTFCSRFFLVATRMMDSENSSFLANSFSRETEESKKGEDTQIVMFESFSEAGLVGGTLSCTVSHMSF